MAEQPTFDIRQAIQAVVEGRELSTDDATAAMDAIMTGQATPAQIGALVTALRMRGETVAEIAGFAAAMRRHARAVTLADDPRPLVDTCGTGGDGAGTFNISTTAAFVIAGAGVRVAKHGNRSVTSQCGSADLLEGLGVKVELTPEQVAESIARTGFGFMFAPGFHPGFRHAGPARREIGIRTIFNALGPLTNPAGVRHQLIGVGHPHLARKLAEANAMLGSRHVVVVHSGDGLDEFGIAGPTQVTEYDARTGEVTTYEVVPEGLGLSRCPTDGIRGGAVAENVRIVLGVLSGDAGACRDVTLLNAGAGLYAADASTSIAEGVAMAAESINSGRALAALQAVIAYSHELAAEPVRV
ncbi:MAG: anthranilate phosphoribosyltransferase [Thermomicrobiales bacterium]|jgi:anthranilate phosphoribosyltransferase|nr:anthranilate phosphoribosyltransferase [Thermomicrobiales bacterium]